MNPTKSILIVDDDSSASQLMEQVLLQVGYEVRSADSAHLALSYISERPPQLILLEIRLTDSSGFEVCRRLQECRTTCRIPIMFISAASTAEERMEGFALGAVDFITKPFHPEELIARIRKHLELGRLRSESENQVIQRSVEQRIAVERQMAERKDVKSALRRCEELARLGMDTGRMFAFEWDPATDRIRRSYDCAEILGVHGDATADTGAEFLQRFHPADRDSFRRKLAQLTSSRDTCQSEDRIIRADGSITYLRSSIRARFNGGRVTSYIGVSADITQAKQAEAASVESEERFRNMADAAPVLIWVAGSDQMFTFVNRGWLTFTGRAMEQELGNGWLEGIHPDDRKAYLVAYASASGSHESFRSEYRLRNACGEYRRILVTGTPRFAPGGAFSGYVGSCVDVTDLRQAQEQAFDRQKMESLHVLTSGIAHDFNNLLGSILTHAELAEAELPPGSSACEQIRNIQAVAVRAAEIVRELMDYSGQEVHHGEPVDVSNLVAEMLELLKTSVSKNAALWSALGTNLPKVSGNQAQIRQVVMNLIINASEAIGEKEGVIRISTSCVRIGKGSPPWVSGRLNPGNYIQLKISDNGCGLDEELRARIFEPFFTTKFAGRGLGLPVVHEIVQAHRGAVAVESTPGVGATFEVLLPCVERVLPIPPVKGAAQASIPAQAGAVLLVEDEESLREAVSQALHKRGFSVFAAGTGDAAVDTFETHAKEIDVVLLDWTLPGLPASEVLDRIRNIEPDARVVLTSAYDCPNTDRAIFGDPTLNRFLRKPYRFDDLVRALDQARSRA
jgi:PAS domain S-box-containing protein